MALHPSGTRVYLFQSYGPLRASYANIDGFIRDARMRLTAAPNVPGRDGEGPATPRQRGAGEDNIIMVGN